MSSVSDRIRKAPACTFIELSEDEKQFYQGGGRKLARFVEGKLVGFFDPLDVEWQPDIQAMIDDCGRAAIGWMSSAEGEVWLVMCSCYQLCEPRLISPVKASDLAHMLRVFGDVLADS